MSRHLLLSLLLLLPALRLPAQHLLGLTPSIYAGVNGVTWNPASIAGTRVKASINLVNLDFHATNDYIRYDGPNSLVQNYDDFSFEEKYITRILNGKPKSFSTGRDVRGPDS
jgi:hypothetical protein